MLSSSNDLVSTRRAAGKRLPPNPYRHKVPPERRKRTATACNSCNVKRVKCSGGEPCSRCVASSATCEYPLLKGRKALVPQQAHDDQRRAFSILEKTLAEVIPSAEVRSALLSKWANRETISSDTADTSQILEDEPQKLEAQGTEDGRILQDATGYKIYLGESAGGVFLDRLREFARSIMPLLSESNTTLLTSMEWAFTSLVGQHHTYESSPLYLPAVDVLQYPELEDVVKLLATFRSYAEDGLSMFPCGGIHYWGDLQEITRRALLSPSTDNSASLSCLNTVMALACHYETTLCPPWEMHPGETYFARAKLLLTDPMDCTSLSHMRAFTLMAYYLLCIYRREAAYIYIGIAARISVIHGLHRGCLINTEGTSAEQIKREFWNMFIVDRWLNCLLGRPPAIPKASITAELPVDIAGTELPPATGLREHVKLCLIMDDIVNVVYKSADKYDTSSRMHHSADSVLKRLSTWQAELPLALQVQTNITVPNRANLTLDMMYNQLVILCTRPILFLAIKTLVAYKINPPPTEPPPSLNFSQIKACAEAARRITSATRQLMSSGLNATFALVDYHFSYTACIVLQLVRLLPEVRVESDKDDLSFIITYFQHAGEKGNMIATEGMIIVVELGAVVLRLLQATMQSEDNTGDL